MEIAAELKDGILKLYVRDNGPGILEEKLQKLLISLHQVDYHDKSLGLHNISRRLLLLYGEKSGVAVRNRDERGFEVILSIDQTYIDNMVIGGQADV